MTRPPIYKTVGGEAETTALYDEALAKLDVEYESRAVETRYGATHVLVCRPDSAPPLVVLPGVNFLNPLCLALFSPLARSHRLYTPDIVGQPGKSAPTHPSPKGDGHALWLEDVLDTLGLGSVPFVGVSYGAGLILRLSGLAPERISRAVAFQGDVHSHVGDLVPLGVSEHLYEPDVRLTGVVLAEDDLLSPGPMPLLRIWGDPTVLEASASPGSLPPSSWITRV